MLHLKNSYEFQYSFFFDFKFELKFCLLPRVKIKTDIQESSLIHCWSLYSPGQWE